MYTFTGPSQLRDSGTMALGCSDWLTIDQPMINRFAEATGDRQWIHLDGERAAAGPFGATVAHGLLTLSLLPRLVAETYRVDGVSERINYGYDRVRFPHPVRVDNDVRACVTLLGAEQVASGTRARLSVTVEIDGEDRPACVAESIVQFVGAE